MNPHAPPPPPPPPPHPYAQRPPYPPPPPPQMLMYPPAMAAAPTDTKATVSLVLGILSLVGIFCYMGAFLGIPAIILGFMSRSSIKKSDGQLQGGGMAMGGIVTGFIGTGVWFAIIGLYVALFAAAATAPSVAPPPPLPPAATYTSSPTAAPTTFIPSGGFGAIHVVDLRSAAGPLKTQLDAERTRATAAGEKLIVMTVSKGCIACNEIAMAMPDPAMQTALANVTVVRVDMDDFATDLATLKMKEANAPWFYTLDASLKVTGAISADEWDDNVAANVAPVLEAFVKGTHVKRKQGPPAAPKK